MAIDPGPLQSVLGDLLSRLGTNHDPLATWVADPRKIATADKDMKDQRWWSTALGTRGLNELVDAAGPRDQARLLEQRHGLGSS